MSQLIVIVDDDAPLLAALGNLARSVGYRAALFKSAEACIAAVPGMAVDLLLTDFRMPGATGLELIEALRRRGCNAPAIVMTAQAHDEVAALALPAGTLAVLAKPFDEHDLLDAIDMALTGAARSAGSGAP